MSKRCCGDHQVDHARAARFAADALDRRINMSIGMSTILVESENGDFLFEMAEVISATRPRHVVH